MAFSRGRRAQLEEFEVDARVDAKRVARVPHFSAANNAAASLTNQTVFFRDRASARKGRRAPEKYGQVYETTLWRLASFQAPLARINFERTWERG